MIAHTGKLSIASVIFMAAMAAFKVCAAAETVAIEGVHRVVDGDTLETADGTRIRLLGIDAPEKGDPYARAAAKRLGELTASGELTLRVCDERDDYGRVLATVLTTGGDLNRILLSEGLALPMLIPPCAKGLTEGILRSTARGLLSGRGIYTLQRYRIVSDAKAVDFIGSHAVVRGAVRSLHKGPEAWHLNFGHDWKTDFTAVLFREGQRKYIELDMDPADLVGSEVLVLGKLKRYNGPEIIVRGPEQIIPLEGISVRDSSFRIQKDKMER